MIAVLPAICHTPKGATIKRHLLLVLTVPAAGVLGNPAVNYSFLVFAQNGCGASGPSNRTAEFDFGLIPGSP